MTDLTDFATKYAPAPESTDHVDIKKRYSLFINGEFTKPSSGKYFPTINPATEKTLSEVAEADKADVDKAVQSARKAYENTWSKIPAKERGKYIYRISRMLQEKSREFAVIESMDGGKPIRESRDVDIPLAAAHFFYYSGWADKLEYAFPGRQAKSLGVAGQIIPWNFPLLMAAWKLGPALAAGNCVVMKPAEQTPASILVLMALVGDLLPPGVLNIVNGVGEEAGQALATSDRIAKLAFTGSTPVGQHILRCAAETLIPSTSRIGKSARWDPTAMVSLTSPSSALRSSPCACAWGAT